MVNFAKRLALAMIRAGYVKQKQSWFKGKELDEITGQLDQTRLSDETNIKNYTLNRHLRKRQKPHLDDLRTYAQTLDISADWLIGLTDQMMGLNRQEYVQDSVEMLTCDSNDTNLYGVIRKTLAYQGFEDNTPYPEHIKSLFCIAASNKHQLPVEEVYSMVRLFYVDYLFFLLTIAGASSLVEPQYFQNNIGRNIAILNYLFLLLPHKLNDRIEHKLQQTVTKLLQLEIRKPIREAVGELFCITSLSFYWLNHKQPFSMILALKGSGTQIVVNLVNSIIHEYGLAMKPIDLNIAYDQEKLIVARNELRQLITDAIEGK